jgi:hypothetical protein
MGILLTALREYFLRDVDRGRTTKCAGKSSKMCSRGGRSSTSGVAGSALVVRGSTRGARNTHDRRSSTEGDAGEAPQARGAGAGETLQDTGKQEETNTAIRTKTC